MRAANQPPIPLEGTVLIEASAGTGKTHTITNLFVQLVVERALAVDEILVVTFTNAATAELRDRIRIRLLVALRAWEAGASSDPDLDALVRSSTGRDRDTHRLAQALRDFDQAGIFTIHGFCERMLHRHAFESGMSFEAELLVDQAAMLDEVVHDFWHSKLDGCHPSLIRYLEARGVTPRSLACLAQKAVVAPGARMIPGPRKVQLQGALGQWREAARELRSIWEQGRGEVEELLASPALNRNCYRAESVAKWIAQMNALLGQPDAGAAVLFDGFRRFTPQELRAATRKGAVAPSHPFFAACDRVMAAWHEVQRVLSIETTNLKLELVEYARRELASRKRSQQVIAFDDLLELLDRALSGPQGERLAEVIRAQYPAAIIDEFQDTDPIQYRILRTIYHGSNATLLLIGDRKQAIYGFRGADLFAYLRAAQDTAGKSVSLRVNWRSDPGLVRGVLKLFGRCSYPFLLPQIQLEEVRARPGSSDCLRVPGRLLAPLHLLFVARNGRTSSRGDPTIPKRWADANLPKFTAAEIARLLRSGATINDRAIDSADVAVLVRKNSQGRAMQQALASLGIRSVLHSDASVFESDEAEQIQRVLGAVAEPTNAPVVAAALATPLLGAAAHELMELREDQARWETWTRSFQKWHSEWREHGFIQGFRRMLDQHGVHQRLLSLRDGERRLTNLLQLAELLQDATVRQHLGLSGLATWLQRMRTDAGARDQLGPGSSQIRLESDEHAISIVTMHKSKGLQYPIVFCPFSWDGALLRDWERECLQFHDPEHDNEPCIDLGCDQHEPHVQQAQRERMAELLRLLYVAVTRAKHHCTLVWGAFKECQQSPLGYLLHHANGGDGDLWQETQERVRGLDDEGMLADLHALERDAEGSISVSILDSSSALPPAQSDLRCEPLVARQASRPLDIHWRTGSFSSLTSKRPTVGSFSEAGFDRDEQQWGAPPSDDRPADKATGAPVELHAFPRGARAGELIHKLFEILDFPSATPDVVQPLAAGLLTRHGLDPSLSAVLTRAVQLVLDTPLSGSERFCLRAVPMAARLQELEFTLPVAHAPQEPGERAQPRARPLSVDTLAEVFAAEIAPGCVVARDYPSRLRTLGALPLQGYLRGFMDLVFEHAQRWYLVDYKSNYLGDYPCDYAASRLVREMSEHHYFLQYHLYVVALDRYLRQRLRGYQYERDFGGVRYLFVRGMSPATGDECGVFCDRPRPQLVENLSAILGPVRARQAVS